MKLDWFRAKIVKNEKQYWNIATSFEQFAAGNGQLQ